MLFSAPSPPLFVIFMRVFVLCRKGNRRKEKRGKVSAGERKKKSAEEGREEGVCSVTHARVYEYMCI